MLLTFTAWLNLITRPDMPIAAKLDELGMPAWIALMVLSFVFYWPLGLAILAFLIWSGRMGCGMHGGPGRYERKMARLQERMDRARAYMDHWSGSGSGGRGGDWWGAPRSSGHRALDDFKQENFRRAGRGNG